MNSDDYEIFFWDFDGVIKDSVDIKANSFEFLFKKFGLNIQEKVRHHHLENGGMSRFEKIPLYLSWVNENNKENIKKYLNDFKRITFKKVIASKWVPGVKKFIEDHSKIKKFFLVSATPEKEIQLILNELNFSHHFVKIFGSPIKKSDAIKQILNKESVTLKKCLMIGDAIEDLKAAEENKITFVLNKHEHNLELFSNHKGLLLRDFIN